MLSCNDLLEISKDNLKLEDLFTTIYCAVDDYYKLLVGSQKTLRNSNNGNPRFTDSEVITIALVGELSGENSEKAWCQFVRKNYRELFPALCSRTRYGRRVRKLTSVIEMIRQQLLYQLDINEESYRLVDSFPLRLVRLSRLSTSSQPFGDSATVGYCSSHKEHYYGFKVNLVTDLRGIPVAFVLTPAYPHDSQTFIRLLDELIELGLSNTTLIFLGDKAYVGEEYANYLNEKYGIKLLAIQRNYDKDIPVNAINVLLTKTRRIIETTIAVCTETLNANWTFCRSIKGLITRMLTKITAFNMANYLNSIMEQPLLEIKNFVK